MKKKNDTISAAHHLREEADASVAAMVAARAAAAAASSTFQTVSTAAEQRRTAGGSSPIETQLAIAVADIARLETEEAARQASAAASIALDDAESAEGDDLAVAASRARVHAEIVAIDAEEQRAQAALLAISHRRIACRDAAIAASHALAARRAAAGQPPPVSLPWAGGQMHLDTKTVLDSLANRDLPPPRQAERVRQLRQRERELRMDIETAHRAALKRKAEQAALEKDAERDRAAAAKRATEEHEAWVAKVRKEQAKADELVAAQRAREASQ